MGATVERVRPVSITHKDHFVHVARRRAFEARAAGSAPESQLYNLAKGNPQLEKRLDQQVKSDSLEAHKLDSQSANTLQIGDPMSKDELCALRPTEMRIFTSMGLAGVQSAEFDRQEDGSNECSSTSSQGGYFADQFENLANFRAHYEGTGPEIWEQTGGKVDAFVAAAGTGGTIAGVSRFLKEKSPEIRCYLIDPPGSGLYNRVTRGVMYTKEEAEGKRVKNPFDTITEGIGINRITENFKQAQLDGAFRGTDKEAVEMARYLMKNDGLFVGSSSAMNCVGAVRVAQLLGPGHAIVTILCDGGARHLSKFHNPAYLAGQRLTPSASALDFLKTCD